MRRAGRPTISGERSNMPAFRSLTFTEARQKADRYSENKGKECFVYHVWDTDTQPGGGFDWCPEGARYYIPEVKDQDIVYHTQEGYYE